MKGSGHPSPATERVKGSKFGSRERVMYLLILRAYGDGMAVHTAHLNTILNTIQQVLKMAKARLSSYPKEGTARWTLHFVTRLGLVRDHGVSQCRCLRTGDAAMSHVMDNGLVAQQTPCHVSSHAWWRRWFDRLQREYRAPTGRRSLPPRAASRRQHAIALLAVS